ncbi:unnamed protein product, partial [Musa acuminata var. zebrina]
VGRGFDYRSSTPLLKFSKNLGGKFGRLRASHGGHFGSNNSVIFADFLKLLRISGHLVDELDLCVAVRRSVGRNFLCLF